MVTIQPSSPDAHLATTLCEAGNPRTIGEEDFPNDGSESDWLRFLVNFAVLAPSTYNSQPWAWRLSREGLFLYLDRERIAPATDPEGREQYIACGAALFNLRIAAHHFGHQEDVHFFPSGDSPDCLARINLTGQHWPSDTHNLLFEAIPRRRTCRQPFVNEPLPASFLFDVKGIARLHGTRLRVITPEERDSVVELVQRGAVTQGQAPAFQREVSSWMRQPEDSKMDGLPAHLLEGGTLHGGKQQAARDASLASEAPALVLLDTDCDSPRDWLLAGEALQHILLHACSQGVSVSYFNQPIHVSALWRKLLQELKLSSFPQLLFRFGRTQAEESVEMTPRRPLAEVLTED